MASIRNVNIRERAVERGGGSVAENTIQRSSWFLIGTDCRSSLCISLSAFGAEPAAPASATLGLSRQSLLSVVMRKIEELPEERQDERADDARARPCRLRPMSKLPEIDAAITPAREETK
jgi:hypothetical protein